MEKESLKKEKT